MKSSRHTGIDATRGIVMIIMALDHVREYFHTTALTVSPTDLEKTTTALFLTRWVTHLCAPAFVFLAGISVWMKMKKESNPKTLSRYLLQRGILLVILEFTLINFILWFDIRFRLLILEVIGAIGISFIILSFMVRINSRIIGLAGILIIAANGIFYGLTDLAGFTGVIQSVFSKPGLLQVGKSLSVFTAYPVIPWLGIMMAGYGAGEIFTLDSVRRKKMLLWSGIAFIILAVTLRFLNLYGDQSPWSINSKPGFTILSFLNISKYPPSLIFSFFFAGITLLLLLITEQKENSLTAFFATYGRAPLFYFIFHLLVIHLLMFGMLFLQGHGAGDLVFGMFKNGRPEAGGGYDLWGVYAVWIVVVLLFYPICKWYGNIKANGNFILLKYL